jgi:hypothetical protein
MDTKLEQKATSIFKIVIILGLTYDPVVVYFAIGRQIHLDPTINITRSTSLEECIMSTHMYLSTNVKFICIPYICLF